MNEIVVGSAVVTGVETLIATLTAWHAYVDVYVDASPTPRIAGTIWNVYAVSGGTRTRIASGVFTASPGAGQRVISKIPGRGTTIELRAITHNGSTVNPITAAIVGWDPGTTTPNADDASGFAGAIVPGPETFIAAIPWHPHVSAYVEGLAQARGSLWLIKAVIAGFAAEILIERGAFGDVEPGREVCSGEGGASSWTLYATTPIGPTGALTASLFGNTSPSGGNGTTPGGTPAVIFDGGTTTQNLRSDRSANQSAINNAKDGIVNLSSDTSGAAPGATGDYATIAGGNSNSAQGDYACVGGGQANQAQGNFSCVPGGDANTVLGVAAFAMGIGCSANGVAAHAFGNGSSAGGDASSAEGTNCGTLAQAGHAEGLDTLVGGFGIAAHAEGRGTIANANAAHAEGRESNATRDTQSAHASGMFLAPGDAQTSRLVLRGETPGAAPGEMIELFSEAGFGLEFKNLRGYAIEVTCVVRGNIAAVGTVRTFRQTICVRRTAGVSAIAGSSVLESFGDAAAASWGLTFAIVGVASRLSVKVDTGATTSAIKAAARMVFTEVENVAP